MERKFDENFCRDHILERLKHKYRLPDAAGDDAPEWQRAKLHSAGAVANAIARVLANRDKSQQLSPHPILSDASHPENTQLADMAFHIIEAARQRGITTPPDALLTPFIACIVFSDAPDAKLQLELFRNYPFPTHIGRHVTGESLLTEASKRSRGLYPDENGPQGMSR